MIRGADEIHVDDFFRYPGQNQLGTVTLDVDFPPCAGERRHRPN